MKNKFRSFLFTLYLTRDIKSIGNKIEEKRRTFFHDQSNSIGMIKIGPPVEFILAIMPTRS